MKNMFNVTTVLSHNLLQTNPCVSESLLHSLFLHETIQLHLFIYSQPPVVCHFTNWWHLSPFPWSTAFTRTFATSILWCYNFNGMIKWHDFSCATLYMSGEKWQLSTRRVVDLGFCQTTHVIIIIIVIIPHNRNTAHVKCKNEGDTSSNWSDRNYFQIIQKTREQHTRTPWC